MFHVYIYMHVYTYIYIYIERERETYTYIYIYNCFTEHVQPGRASCLRTPEVSPSSRTSYYCY